MAKTFKLQIVTQEKVAFDGDIESLVVPAENGYLGVLAHHAPLLAALTHGRVTVDTGLRTLEGEVNDGFIEVQNNTATILTSDISGDFAKNAAN
ncbi:F0F1 ATP synthase subunit epsilon [Candidatus Sumerlaeota bacterium]|nr:F0F1 ATP synthase subunit epsilon [Candidatus Sumerlaeota bacterium]